MPLLLNRRAAGVLCIELRFKAERDYERTAKFFGVIASMIAHAIKVQRLLEADRERLMAATDAVLAITGQPELLADNEVLRRSIEVRNPYVDPINLVQIELLRRLALSHPAPGLDAPGDDASDQTVAVLRKALRITISGVAAGMRNTG